MIHLCKLTRRLFFSLRQRWNDCSYRHSFEMIVFLSEKPAEAKLQMDLRFSDREQTGTCSRYTWNSSDSSAPKMCPRLFLTVVVKNKGSVLLLCMCCHSISRRKKQNWVSFWKKNQKNKLRSWADAFCQTWSSISFAGVQNNHKYNLCIAGGGIKKRRRSSQLGQLGLHPQIWWQCPHCPVAHPQFYKQRVPPMWRRAQRNTLGDGAVAESASQDRLYAKKQPVFK